MLIRPLTAADLDLIDEIDATLESATYLHVDRHAEGLSTRFAIEERPIASGTRIESGAIGDDLRFSMKQIVGLIEDGAAIAAEHEGVPVAAIFARNVEAERVIDVIDVRVDFDHRRQGLASAMLFQVINAARDLEYRAIRVQTTTANVPVAKLLNKLGFELAGIDTHRNSNHDLVKERSTLVWYLALD